jgi:hypothetical protein
MSEQDKLKEDKEVAAIMKINEVLKEIKDPDDISRILEYFTARYCFSYKNGRESTLRNIEFMLNKYCKTDISEP